MRRLTLFMHVSLDGMISGPNGEMDWIHVDDEIFDYAGNRTNNSDLALYGRVTYEMMDAYWPTAADQPGAGKHEFEHSAWYNSVEKIILSKTLSNLGEKRTVISNNVKEEVTTLKNSGDKEIIMFGSPGAAQSLMDMDLIDEYWIFVNPIILANGKRLFDNISHTQKLELISIHPFASGVVCLHYRKKGN